MPGSERAQKRFLYPQGATGEWRGRDRNLALEATWIARMMCQQWQKKNDGLANLERTLAHVIAALRPKKKDARKNLTNHRYPHTSRTCRESKRESLPVAIQPKVKKAYPKGRKPRINVVRSRWRLSSALRPRSCRYPRIKPTGMDVGRGVSLLHLDSQWPRERRSGGS